MQTEDEKEPGELGKFYTFVPHSDHNITSVTERYFSRESAPCQVRVGQTSAAVSQFAQGNKKEEYSLA